MFSQLDSMCKFKICFVSFLKFRYYFFKNCQHPSWSYIRYESMNGLYKMRYSHEMNDKWFMAFHVDLCSCFFAPFLYVFARFCSHLYSSLVTHSNFAIKLCHCYCLRVYYYIYKIYTENYNMYIVSRNFFFVLLSDERILNRSASNLKTSKKKKQKGKSFEIYFKWYSYFWI